MAINNQNQEGTKEQSGEKREELSRKDQGRQAGQAGAAKEPGRTDTAQPDVAQNDAK